MKTRVLWVSECSVLRTGYATYSREILKRLHASNQFEIAEFAIYIHHTDPRLNNIPWQVYANLPDKNNEADMQRYNSSPTNQFGEWRFEEVCLDFKPHVVCDIRDFWMLDFQDRSPFRPYFNWCIMPTVDSYPQNEQWLSTYANADAVFTYQDWSLNVLNSESGNKIKTICSAPPSAEDEFQPIEDKEALKKQLGYDGYKIVGTIMRNQRRKLYPDLFEGFRKFLDKTGRDDVLLYCHTSYPDMGWDLPKWILKYGIASKTLLTYVCRNCGHAFPLFFNDALTTCIKCGQNSASVASVQQGVENDVLSTIINTFDLYVQYANSEGFGLPQVEAAACAVPVMAVDFSAMKDVIRKLDGVPLKPLTQAIELETGCFRAIPDNDLLAAKMEQFFNLSDEQQRELGKINYLNYKKHYNWDVTANKWMQYISNVNAEEYERRWYGPPRTHQPSNQVPQGLGNADFSKWLIAEVLGEPERLNSYMEMRLVKDLNYGVTIPGTAGMYFNDMSAFFSRPNYTKFGREEAYNHMVTLCERRNEWERRRWQSIQAKQSAGR